MHLIHIVRLYFFFCLCIEKHSRNCIFLLSKLITPIFYVCKNLIQIIGMNRMFIKLGLCCVTIVFCVNNKYSTSSRFTHFSTCMFSYSALILFLHVRFQMSGCVFIKKRLVSQLPLIPLLHLSFLLPSAYDSIHSFRCSLRFRVQTEVHLFSAVVSS